MPQVKQIFISYDQVDNSFAHRLADDLKSLGAKVWIAPESIRPGENWVDAINQGLQESSHIIIVLTPSAIDSQWVKMETNAAIALERKGQIQMIPLDVEPCEPPLLLSSYQMISFREGYKTALNHLITNLQLQSPSNVQHQSLKQNRDNPSQILIKIKQIMCEHLDVDEIMITPETDIINDLGADELDLFELALLIEEVWNIKIPDDYLALDKHKLQHVSQWISYIAERSQ